MRVAAATDVLKGDAADSLRQLARLRVQRNQSGILHLVAAEHLLDEQQRIGSDVHRRLVVRERPFERREKATVFGDVVRSGANRVAEFLDERAVLALDAHAVSGGPGIAARAAVDVGDDHRATVSPSGAAAAGAGAAAAGT